MLSMMAGYSYEMGSSRRFGVPLNQLQVQPEGVVSIPTSGTIYPGFIDPHNHAHYNIIPLWDHGTNGWQNRYQWQADDAYRDAKDVGCSTSDSSTMRFAELRAIAGGNTAIQGASTLKQGYFPNNAS